MFSLLRLISKVPAGIWEIYPSNPDCCTQNFPYSQVCNVIKGTDAPTKYPTLAAAEEPEFEIVPIKFSVMGLPDDAKMRDLKNEMQDVLKRILTGLSEVFTDLKISKVEERAVIERNRNLKENSRSLAKDVDVYFDVYVVNTSGKKWGRKFCMQISILFECLFYLLTFDFMLFMLTLMQP